MYKTGIRRENISKHLKVSVPDINKIIEFWKNRIKK